MINIPYLRNLYQARSNKADTAAAALDTWLIAHDRNLAELQRTLQTYNSELPTLLAQAAAEAEKLSLSSLQDYPPYRDLLAKIAISSSRLQTALNAARNGYLQTHAYNLYECAYCKDTGTVASETGSASASAYEAASAMRQARRVYCPACFKTAFLPYLRDMSLWQVSEYGGELSATESLAQLLMRPQRFLEIYRRSNPADFYSQEEKLYLSNLNYVKVFLRHIIGDLIKRPLTGETAAGRFSVSERVSSPTASAPVGSHSVSGQLSTADDGSSLKARPLTGNVAVTDTTLLAYYKQTLLDLFNENDDNIVPKRRLLLSGAVGSGKSYLAAKIADQVQASGIPAVFVQAQSLAAALRKQDILNQAFAPDLREQDRYRQYFALLFSVPLVVIDDLATINLTQSQLLYLFNNFKADQRLVITTNLSLPQIQSEYGERVLSRLLEDTQVMTFNTADLRLAL